MSRMSFFKKRNKLFPPLEPYDTGFLKKGKREQIIKDFYLNQLKMLVLLLKFLLIEKMLAQI